jgi:hypothetical protein
MGSNQVVSPNQSAARRRLLVLLKRARHVDERVGRAQRGAARPLHAPHIRRLVEESGALGWALQELARVHPAAAADARRDLERDEERRRERGDLDPA